MDLLRQLSTQVVTCTTDSKKFEYGMIYTGVPSCFGLGLGDGHVPTFWLLPYSMAAPTPTSARIAWRLMVSIWNIWRV